MKLTKLALAAGAIVMAGGVYAQSSATGTATANAKVIAPITITPVNTLEFGNVVPGASLGTIAVAANGTASVTGGVTQPGTQAGTVRAASFTVAGEKSFTYSITLPSSATLTDGTPAHDMTVDTFVSSPTPTGTLDATLGTQTLSVGAKLHVAANQVAGTYSGTFDVTVAYN